MAVRARPSQPGHRRSLELTRTLFLVAGLVVGVMIVVLFIPGVRDYIEGHVLTWLARLAG